MSEKRRDDAEGADERELEALAEAIAVSLRPRDIDQKRHEDILARALGPTEFESRPEAEADPDERRGALDLRMLLDASAQPASSRLDAPELRRLVGLAQALRLAYAPHEVDQVTNERLLRPALKLSTAAVTRRYATAVTFALAAAAAVLFFLVRPPKDGGASLRAEAPPLPMIGAHSAMDLFDPAEPFPRSGGTTSRIDKIAASRDTELRDNLFASWGVE